MSTTEVESCCGQAGLGTALFSPCGRWRYLLTRTWGSAPPVVFCMLNPSTADDRADDPTVRRCRGFARAWGYGGLVVVNAYGWRAVDPAALWRADDPVGRDNDRHLVVAAAGAALVVAAWGAQIRRDRAEQIRRLPGFERLFTLGVTRSGQPRHPLYAPARTKPTWWHPATTNRAQAAVRE